MRGHPVVRIAHGLFPQRLLLRRQGPRPAPRSVKGGEMHDQVAEEMNNATGIFLAEAAQRAVGAARIERKDRLQMRRVLLGGVELLSAESGNADHADLAITPGLRRDPLDEVV